MHTEPVYVYQAIMATLNLFNGSTRSGHIVLMGLFIMKYNLHTHYLYRKRRIKLYIYR